MMHAIFAVGILLDT